MNLKGWYKLLVPGTFRDCHNKVVTFTRESLQGILDRYDPQRFEAALTIGHPQSQKEPAYGVVEGLKLIGDALWFKPGRLVKEFAQAVNDGKFFRVSAGLQVLGPESFALDHVAFLGATPPAVDGLGRIDGLTLCAPREGVEPIDVTEATAEWLGKVEFASRGESWLADRIRVIATVLRRVRDREIERTDVESADKLVQPWELEYLDQPVPEEQIANATTAGLAKPQGGDVDFEKMYNELKAVHDGVVAEKVQLSGQIETLNTELTAVKAENLTLKAQASQLTQEKRKADFAAFCETQIQAGRLLPAEKDSTVETMLALENAGVVELAAGQNVSRLDIYKKNIEQRPKLVEFAHVATSHGASSSTDDPNTIALAARKYQDEQAAAGNNIDTVAAVKHVMGK